MDEEQQEVTLSSQEVKDLIDLILVGVEDAEEGFESSTAWAIDMREWCIKLLDRLYDDQGGTTT
jgi:hypothetical protein